MPKAKASKPDFYAVSAGRQPGVYSTWAEAEAQVSGYKGAVHAKCSSRAEAESFVASGRRSGAAPLPTKPKWRSEAVDDDPAPTSAKPGRRVYTDGSCRGNGKNGAYAGIGVYWPHEDTLDLAERLPGERQTNQRAELWAVMRALETDPTPGEPLNIRTDSSYAIDCLSKWHLGWARNGWRNKDGDAVSNADLIQHTLALIRARPSDARIVFTHVKGHSGDAGNTQADRLANEGALRPAVPDVDLRQRSKGAQASSSAAAPEIDPSWLLDDAELDELGKRQSF